MDDLRICGSCHTLVHAEDRTPDICPRCKGMLDPDANFMLHKFIDTGIVEFNQKGGITLHEAQKAAEEILGELLSANIKLKLHHIEGKCSDCGGKS